MLVVTGNPQGMISLPQRGWDPFHVASLLAKWHYHFRRDLGTSPVSTWLRCLQQDDTVRVRRVHYRGSPSALLGDLELSDLSAWDCAPWCGGCSCPAGSAGTHLIPSPLPAPKFTNVIKQQGRFHLIMVMITHKYSQRIQSN